MNQPRFPTAAALIIGDEILSGRTRDSNLAVLAETLEGVGIALRQARFVPDETETIIAAVNELRAGHDHVFTSGGIGPTHDDITADAVAAAFGAPIGVREDARAILEAFYPPGMLNESRLRMARIPEGATLVENPVSAAPGFRIGNVYVLAGVPAIFRVMVEGITAELGGGPRLVSRNITAAVPEGAHAEELRELAGTAKGVRIGSYPFARGGRVGTTIVIRGTDEAEVGHCAERVREIFERLGADDILMS